VLSAKLSNWTDKIALVFNEDLMPGYKIYGSIIKQDGTVEVSDNLILEGYEAVSLTSLPSNKFLMQYHDPANNGTEPNRINQYYILNEILDIESGPFWAFEPGTESGDYPANIKNAVQI
jgi:hypothetical protein